VSSTFSTIEQCRSRPGSPERLVGGTRGSRPSPIGPLVSVVTVAYNSGNTIERTINSVVKQIYPDVELIIIDGSSKDGTVEILRERNEDITFWLSEPDEGISDAFNKGIALSSGAYIAIVNSDDWIEPQHLEAAVDALRHSSADFAFGDLILHPPDGQPPYMLSGEKDYADKLPHSMPQINHPTLVCKRYVYERCGLFDVKLSAAMDFEWLLRVTRQGMVGIYVPAMVAHMSMEGISHRDFARGFDEVRQVSIRYGYSRSLALMRYLTRLASIRTRLILRDYLPRALYLWLWRRINPNYKSIDS
jgi:glycosyltransferase involved in cell wall biosynthesis